jgi:hypothetical protein
MNKKSSDSPSRALFIADPDIAIYLRECQDHLFKHRDALSSIKTPTLDVSGIQELRASTASIFPDREIIALFRPALVQALRLSLVSAHSALPVEDLVFFQLAIIAMRLASDYISAYDIFKAHEDNLVKAYPRIITFNPVTNRISWDKVRRQAQEILEEAFLQRYDEMAAINSDFYRESKLANEALMIGMMIVGHRNVEADLPDGLAFEGECEELLKSAEYSVQRTPMSGDYGVDLVARKNGLTYAIQCKYYGIPVGISAVQEAAAGRVHYLADCAVVVAHSGFTIQARRLAESNAVLLIGLSQLTQLQELARSLI